MVRRLSDDMMQNEFEKIFSPNLSRLIGLMSAAWLLSNSSPEPFVITFLSAKRCHV